MSGTAVVLQRPEQRVDWNGRRADPVAECVGRARREAGARVAADQIPPHVQVHSGVRRTQVGVAAAIDVLRHDAAPQRQRTGVVEDAAAARRPVSGDRAVGDEDPAVAGGEAAAQAARRRVARDRAVDHGDRGGAGVDRPAVAGGTGDGSSPKACCRSRSLAPNSE